MQAEPSQRKPSPPNASRSSGGSARKAPLSEKRLPPPAPSRKAFDARHSVTSRSKSTAVLSAAVDITACNGAHTTFRRNQVSENRPRRTPAVLREGARGRRFSQRSGRLPQRPPGKRCTRRKSTAALSAAVDITTCNGAHTTCRRNQVSGNRPRRTPAALREGARGRRFSQRSGLPRIPAHIIVLIFSSRDSGARYSRCTRGWCGRRRIRRTSPCW